MQQRNGEINPSYSTTIGVDTKSDIITCPNVNVSDNDNIALLPAIDKSEENSGQKHKITVHDSGFSSIANLEKLKERGQDSLMPDKMQEAEAKQTGMFTRKNFIYNKEENYYTCPVGIRLEYTGSYHDPNGRQHYRYSNTYDCARCPHFRKCSKGDSKSISRDNNEELKESMREKLADEKNKER